MYNELTYYIHINFFNAPTPTPLQQGSWNLDLFYPPWVHPKANLFWNLLIRSPDFEDDSLDSKIN